MRDCYSNIITSQNVLCGVGVKKHQSIWCVLASIPRTLPRALLLFDAHVLLCALAPLPCRPLPARDILRNCHTCGDANVFHRNFDTLKVADLSVRDGFACCASVRAFFAFVMTQFKPLTINNDYLHHKFAMRIYLLYVNS